MSSTWAGVQVRAWGRGLAGELRTRSSFRWAVESSGCSRRQLLVSFCSTVAPPPSWSCSQGPKWKPRPLVVSPQLTKTKWGRKTTAAPSKWAPSVRRQLRPLLTRTDAAGMLTSCGLCSPSDNKGLDHSDGFYAGMPLPCSDSHASFCVHGECEVRHSVTTCRCVAACTRANVANTRANVA